MDCGKKVLLGMSLDELQAVVTELGMPKFTAGQLAKWLYQQRVKSIEDIRALKAYEKEGIAGAILGKSLYMHTLSLPEALALAAE